MYPLKFQKHGIGRDIARHVLEGGGGLSHPNQNIALPNKMKPISPFGKGLIFFARFCLFKSTINVLDLISIL